jgi:hypothetical protein
VHDEAPAMIELRATPPPEAAREQMAADALDTR